MTGFPSGIRLVDASGTGYSARVTEWFNGILTVDGIRVGDLDPREGVLVRSRRHGRVLCLMPDMSDEQTRELLGTDVPSRGGE